MSENMDKEVLLLKLFMDKKKNVFDRLVTSVGTLMTRVD